MPFYGAVILCLDEPNVQAILPRVKRPVITYGTSSQADLVISDVRLHGLASDFRLNFRGDDLGIFHLPSPPGIHNVRNAAAAAAVALSLNVPADLIRAGLAKFAGVGRRFEIKGCSRRHARSTITAIIPPKFAPPWPPRAAAATSGCWCSFNRIATRARKHLWDDFCRSFNEADVLVITDIYAAGEAPIEGMTGEQLAEAICPRA